MFKKLKEKITEEVKSSPQRFAEFTQSVSDRLQNSTPDDNLFSIGEDDTNTSADSTNHGFASVSLVSPSQETRSRRLSNSSLASDVSFLPRYEAGSMYHLQSDLDVSASELEDNVSTSSSQLGHLSKEQIYSAFQKSQSRYHKYRGRYTDLGRHYKELEKENSKMKSVLVETQDKAIRRVMELKEQCALEQKAKAHLESALRDEIDEKEIKIKLLQSKIDLLQSESSQSSLISIEPKENDSQTENLDTLTKYLNDARKEIENLNDKIQEMKANTIVYQSKEQEYKNRIANLEKELKQFSEREKETNLKFAQNKMELHNEILSKETEITSLKKEMEILKQNLDIYENESKQGSSSKMENLQSQNKKLIEKLENLSQKCNNLESEVLKVSTYKIEIDNLSKEVVDLRAVNEQLSSENEKKIAEIQELLKQNAQLSEDISKERQDFENQIESLREDAKKGLLSLEPKIREKLQNEYLEKEDNLKKDLTDKFNKLSSNNNSLKEIKIQILQKDELIKNITKELETIRVDFTKKTDDYNSLEKSHLELIEDSAQLRAKIERLEKEQMSADSYDEKIGRLEAHISTLQEELKQNKVLLEKKEKEIVNTSKENLALQQEICATSEKLRLLEERHEAIILDTEECKLLELKVKKLEDEKQSLIEEFEMERKMFNNILEDHKELKAKEEKVGVLKKLLSDSRNEIGGLKQSLEEVEIKNVQLYEMKLQYEKQAEKLAEELRVCQEKIDTYEMEKVESGLLKLKIKKLEEENKSILDSFDEERLTFSKDLDQLKRQLSSQDDYENKDPSLVSVEAKLNDIRNLLNGKEKQNVELAKENLKLQQDMEVLNEKLRILEEKYEAIQVEDTECKLLEMKVRQLEDEKEGLIQEFEMERKMFNELLENHKKLEEKEEFISQLEDKLCKVSEDLRKAQEGLMKEQAESIRIAEEKLIIEKEVSRLKEKIRIFEEREEAFEVNKTECDILLMKLQKLEEEKEKLCESFETERKSFCAVYKESAENQSKIGALEDENFNLKDSISKAMIKLKQLSEKVDLDTQTYSETISQLQEKLKNAELELTKLKDKNVELQEEVNHKDKEISDMTSKLSNLTKVIEKQTFDFNNLLENTKQLDEHMEKLKADNAISLKEEKEKQNQLTVQIEELQNQLDVKTKENELLLAKLKEVEERWEKEKNSCEEKAKEVDNLKMEILQLQKDHQALSDDLERLKTIENDKLNLDKQMKVKIQSEKLLLEEKENILKEIDNLRAKIGEMNSENNELKVLSSQVTNSDKKLRELLTENESLRIMKENICKEMSELNNRIQQLSTDNRNIVEENQRLMGDYSELKVKVETLQEEKIKFDEIKDGLQQKIDVSNNCVEEMKKQLLEVQNQNLELMKSKSNANDIDISKIQQDFYEIKDKCDSLFLENKNLKQEYGKLEEKCNNFSKIKDKLEAQIVELEKQYNELLHEKQLLQDEIQELKTSPITYQASTTSKLDNLELLRCPPAVQPGNNEKENYLEEISILKDKLTKYKSLDITNKSSIEFYENELQKMKNQNDKLTRRLDETLVTLSHCVDLSTSTEIEYLRNVLYNYMMGKESLVLARVIAAVCKFDPQQTELILQKEQQRQSLLGQLGLI
nr:unnamed protein product [Callosobruchus analis]